MTASNQNNNFNPFWVIGIIIAFIYLIIVGLSTDWGLFVNEMGGILGLILAIISSGMLIGDFLRDR